MLPTLTPLGKGIAAAVAIALLVAIFFVGKCSYDRSVIKSHDAQVQQRAAPANDQAATERANDAVQTAKNEQEAHDAIHSVPDAVPAAPSHQLACERLRRRGNPPAACR